MSTTRKLSERLAMQAQHVNGDGYPNGYYSVTLEQVRALEAERDRYKELYEASVAQRIALADERDVLKAERARWRTEAIADAARQARHDTLQLVMDTWMEMDDTAFGGWLRAELDRYEG